MTDVQDMHDEVVNNRPEETAGIEDNSIPGEDDVILTGEIIAPTHAPGRSILTAEQLKVLGAKVLNKNRVKKLDGNSYLQAWDVKATLIRVFGWGGFSTEVIEAKIVKVREFAAGDTGHVLRKDGNYGQKKGDPATPQAIAQVTMRLTLHNIGPTGQDVTHVETAIGYNQQWDIGAACDTAMKTAESDALKRAAIFLGTQFGLGLYNAGGLADVVNKVFVPWQGKIMAELRPVEPAATRAALARATGGTQ